MLALSEVVKGYNRVLSWKATEELIEADNLEKLTS